MARREERGATDVRGRRVSSVSATVSLSCFPSLQLGRGVWQAARTLKFKGEVRAGGQRGQACEWALEL